MSYAYFQGQEAQALSYYKKMLEIEPDEKARKEIAALVEKLEKIVKQNKEAAASTDESIQNAPHFHNAVPA